MKTKFLIILSVLFFISCDDDNAEVNDIDSFVKSSNTIITIPKSELLDFDSAFEREMGVFNLELDVSREAYLDVNQNKLFIPILEGYLIENELQSKSDNKPKIKEVGAGIKFKIARKEPSSNPNRCQGGCKCGVGFRCGSTKYIYVKSNNLEEFDYQTREAVARQFIDTENDFYIFEFTTTGIDWNFLNNE